MVKRTNSFFVFFALAVAICGSGTLAHAERPASGLRAESSTGVVNAPGVVSDINLPSTVRLPRMAPELALQVYSRRAIEQTAKLSEYSDRTIVEAELPDTKQRGEYELVRNFKAPKSLYFSSVKFTGDGFVKSNVITRLLQSEVDHVEKGDPAETAISERNYKFNYKGLESIGGSPVHVFQIKPRRKLPGLFKGKIYIDAYTGSIRRAEGTLAKSPSFFVKKVEFEQDFADINGFTFPTELRSISKARIIGRAIVRIFHRGYELKTAEPQAPAMPVQAAVGVSGGR